MKPSLPTGGVFAVSRKIFEDPDFAPEPFTQREAFMWLVASAAWREHETRGAFGKITLQRGEFCFSIRFLAERWGWSKSRVERFISALKNRDTIRDSKRDGEQVWKISKYNDFQILKEPTRDSKRDSKRDSSGTVAGQQRDKEEDIEDIEDIKPSSLRSEGYGPDEAFGEYCNVARRAGLPLPRIFTKDRRKHIKARLAEHGKEAWIEACRKMEASRFCRGDNNHQWKADIDFLIQDKSFTGLLEGKYDNKPERPKTTAPQPKKSAFQERHENAREQINRALGITDDDKHSDFDNGNIIDLGRANYRG